MASAPPRRQKDPTVSATQDGRGPIGSDLEQELWAGTGRIVRVSMFGLTEREIGAELATTTRDDPGAIPRCQTVTSRTDAPSVLSRCPRSLGSDVTRATELPRARAAAIAATDASTTSAVPACPHSSPVARASGPSSGTSSSVRVLARGALGGSCRATLARSRPRVLTPLRSRRRRCAASPRLSGHCDAERSAHRRRGRVWSSVDECACGSEFVTTEGAVLVFPGRDDVSKSAAGKLAERGDGEPGRDVLLVKVCSLADGDREF